MICYKIKYFFFILLLLCTGSSVAQNLVPNPGFETYVSCPTGLACIPYSPDYTFFPVLTSWVDPSYISTPDYFNACSDPYPVGVPVNFMGSQAAHGGDGYIGIYTYDGNDSMTYSNYREYVECKLLEPMEAGHKYYLSFYTSLAEMPDLTIENHIAIKNLGIYISSTQVNDTEHLYLSYTPQVVNTIGYLTDTINWMKVSGMYVATGGEQWITIGHFYDSTAPLDYVVVDTPAMPIDAYDSYMYIDDVCVIDMDTAITTKKDTTLCASQFPATIHGVAVGSPYEWNTGAATASLSITGPGVYFVKTWGDCVYYVDTIKVTSLIDSQFVRTDDTSVCPLSLPVTLHSYFSAANYTWSSGDTTVYEVASTAGTYWVNSSDGCSPYTDTIKVRVTTIDSFSSYRDTSICRSALPLLIHGHDATHYHWNTGDTGTQLSAGHAGTYIVSSFNTACDYYVDTIRIDSIPPQPFTLGNDTAFCLPGGVLAPDAAYAAYLWSTGATTATITVTEPGQYYLTVIDSCGNVLSDTIDITIIYPVPPVLHDTIICVHAVNVSLGVTGDSLRWYMSLTDTGSATQPFINTSDTGELTLFVSASNKCGESDKLPVYIRIEDKPYLSLQDDTTICVGDELHVAAYSNASSYLWNSGDTSCCINIAAAGKYILTAGDICGSNTDSINVLLQDCDACIWIPDAFTPNGDGKNDKFNIITHCPTEGYHLLIYNRWGQVVFESTNIADGWDGMFNNKMADIGTYYYLLQTDSRIKKGEKILKKGDIALIR